MEEKLYSFYYSACKIIYDVIYLTVFVFNSFLDNLFVDGNTLYVGFHFLNNICIVRHKGNDLIEVSVLIHLETSYGCVKWNFIFIE